jgi:CheY-like chemotaxis protein
VLIVAPAATEAALVARRLADWGAKTAVVSRADAALLRLSEHSWDAILVDHALGSSACAQLAQATPAIGRRLVLITPAERHELAGLEQAGFTGYLVKPVRAASLAARFDDEHDDFARALMDEAAPVDAAHAGLSILVAEDNDINALLAQALLKRLGHHPTLVPNGEAAVQAWRDADAAGAPYDLVLMDLHMPGSDGLAATRSIRALEAARDAQRTPIIALTANAFAEDREACLSSGMDGFLTKPLDRERLAAALAQFPTRSPLAA